MNARPWGIPRFLVRQLAAGQTFRYDGHAFVNQPSAPTLIEFVTAPDSTVWDNMPAAVTEFDGDSYYYRRLDSTYLTEAKLWVDNDVAGSTGADILFQYGPGFTNWVTICSVVVDTIGGHESAWTALPSAAKTTDMFFRLAGQDGNASADPRFRNITVQLR